MADSRYGRNVWGRKKHKNDPRHREHIEPSLAKEGRRRAGGHFDPEELSRDLKKEGRKVKREELTEEAKKRLDDTLLDWGGKVDDTKLKIKIGLTTWIIQKIKYLIKQDTKIFHEILIASNPNPYSSDFMGGTAGAVAATAKGVQLLIMPLQKALQYWNWKTYVSPDKDDPNYGRPKKPKFRRRDMMYLALDITMLALTIAAFAVAAPIAGAAIALAAAGVSATVGTYHLVKFYQDGKKLKQEKVEVDDLIKKLETQPDAELSWSEKAFIESHKIEVRWDRTNEDYKKDLQTRSKKLGERMKESISSQYHKARQFFGFGLTMTMIVAGSLVLGGLMLGPVGAPVVMAGVGLSIAAGAIAGGLFIVNTVRNYRINKANKEGKSTRVIKTELPNKKELSTDKTVSEKLVSKNDGVRSSASSSESRRESFEAEDGRPLDIMLDESESESIEMTGFKRDPSLTGTPGTLLADKGKKSKDTDEKNEKDETIVMKKNHRE